MSALAPDHDNPEVETLYRFEECRKCSSRLLVGYYYETGTDNDCGHYVHSLGPCGRPDRCGEKVQGVPDVEYSAWRSKR